MKTTNRTATIRRLCKARKLSKHYWSLACHHDGMPTDTMFAAFSPGNPWTNRASRATVIQARAVLALRRTL